MALVDKIANFPHGMDIGIALQPAVLSSNADLRIPPATIIQEISTQIGDLRALECWSWIERQFRVAGSYQDKRSVAEFVDASRKAILLCGRLGLKSRAENTARRIIHEFGVELNDDGDDDGKEGNKMSLPHAAMGSKVLGATGYAGLAAASWRLLSDRA